VTARVPGAVRGRPSAARLQARVEAAHARADRSAIELEARAHEAEAFTIAARLTLRELEAVLLRPQYEYPVEALALTARLRSMTERYRVRWGETS
jgi:hypothetical protein